MDMRKIATFLRPEEGLRLKLYADSVGKLSIGLGRNLQDNGISNDEAEYLFANDITQASSDCKEVFPDIGEFTEGQQTALISMMFNLGIGKFRKFKRMIAAVNQRDWEAVRTEMKDSLRYRQIPNRVEAEMRLV